MTLWLVLAAVTIAVLWALLRPLFRPPQEGASRLAYDAALYRDQLAELEREGARGLIAPAELEAAKRELARRLLAASADPAAAAEPVQRAAGAPVPGRTARRWIALGVAGLVPVAALALYLDLGAPEAPDFPLASRAGSETAGMPDLATAVGRLESRLAEHPDDQQGWLLLARSDGALGRYAEAADAYRHLLKLTGERPEFESDYAETLVMQAGGLVTAPAGDIFQKVHAALPADPRACFYLALRRSQKGDGKGALEDWLALEADAPKDAPWLPALRAEIKRVAGEYKLDPAKLTPTPSPSAASNAAPPNANPPGAAPGPGTADVAAAANMAPEARDQMIRAMVERLAARLKDAPGDLDGWRRLARAYRVLGEPEKSVDALAHAAALAPKDADLLVDYGEALLAAAKPDAALPAAAVAVMRQVLTLDGQRREALWYVGEAEAEQGDKQGAASLWGRLLSQLPPGTPEFDRVKQKIEALGPLR
jgi:cytochrome c-type biogenesis protein CcmH